jgi:hypothetical protein
VATLNGHRVGLSAICEDLPEDHNRVTLDPVLKDGNGIPAPRIDYTIGENTARMMEHGISRAKEVLPAAETTDICINSPILYGGWIQQKLSAPRPQHQQRQPGHGQGPRAKYPRGRK